MGLKLHHLKKMIKSSVEKFIYFFLFLHKSTVLKTVRFCPEEKRTNQWNRKECLEIDPETFAN
jgi:hypothetical protein